MRALSVDRKLSPNMTRVRAVGGSVKSRVVVGSVLKEVTRGKVDVHATLRGTCSSASQTIHAPHAAGMF